MLMEMSMMVLGLMIKHMVMVFTDILMEPNTKENGKKTNSMVRVLKLGLMVLSMKALGTSTR